MTMMIFDLPRDLLMEIFSRVPLKSVREVRLTCKKFNTLSKSQSFLKMYLAKEETSMEEGESRRVVILDYKLSLMSVIVGYDRFTKPKVKLGPLKKQVKISQVFHCEGLLLCIFKDNKNIVVWNPYLGQTRWIKTRYTLPKMYGVFDRYRYALGYTNDEKNTSLSRRRSHKFLRFLDDDIGPLGNNLARRERFQWYEIYDFDSDQWKTLLNVPKDLCISLNNKHGVSIKGNTYFFATKANSEYNYYLICFDFTREAFGQLICLPPISRNSEYVTLSCVGEEKIAVLVRENTSDLFNVWITNKIVANEEVSWSKFLTVLNMDPEYPISTSAFFFDKEHRVAIRVFESGWSTSHHTLSIIGEDGYLQRLDLGERVYENRRSKIQVCSYVPSLVQIKQPKGKRKQEQSILEQRRYDEKMSRLVQLDMQVNKKKSI